MEDELPASDLYFVCLIVHDWAPSQVDILLDKVYAKINTGIRTVAEMVLSLSFCVF